MCSPKQALCIGAAILVQAAPSLGLVADAGARQQILTSVHEEALPMYSYKADCWKSRPVSTALLQKDSYPGAGLEAFTPFETVEKDGFFPVQCAKDYMLAYGDKFGDHRHAYSVGDISNVSIVHYEAHVPREDRVKMTPTACFEFCRTVPEMLFFGINNGRTCYCTPYFKPEASDSSQCDVVCEGDNTQMCGGKTKSSLFEMHMCESIMEDLSDAADKATTLAASLSQEAATAKQMGTFMQTASAKLQDVFGQDGNPGAADLMQKAKEFAGVITHAADDVEAAAEALRGLSTDAGSANSATAGAATSAERLTESTEAAIVKGEAASEELEAIMKTATPGPDFANASAQYYPVMYFVDKTYSSAPSTCTGELTGTPIVGETPDGCASACDADVHNCVGYQFFGDVSAPLCFLFSKLTTATYYSGCEGAFLQARTAAAPFPAECVVKFAKFDGTTLKPDGSGKCTQCLKETTKAARCY